MDSKNNSQHNSLKAKHRSLLKNEAAVDSEALKNHKNRSVQLLAQAIFDNVADSPEELAFRKGDVLTVLEHDQGTLDGWWLCSMRGRQGICPKNRLKLILPNYEACEMPSNGTNLEFVAELSQKLNDTFLYDTPPNGGANPVKVGRIMDYDTPIRHSNCNNKVPFSQLDSTSFSKSLEYYDTPRSLQQQPLLLPSTSFDSLNAGEYDVPRPQKKFLTKETLINRENDSELRKSLQDLHKYQDEALKAASSLIDFIKAHFYEINFAEVQFFLEKLKSALHSLISINKEILNKIGLSANKILKMKLSTSVNVLVETCTYIETIIRSEQLVSDTLIKMLHTLIENIQETMSYILESLDNSMASHLVFEGDVKDYDYVNINGRNHSQNGSLHRKEETKKVNGRKNEVVLANNQLENLDDKDAIKFYAATAVMCGANLTQAVDAFFQSIEHNQPPKVFLANAKLVALLAFRLLYMGNIIGRSISDTDTRVMLQQFSNLLNESLVLMNLKSKQAAMFFPSVPAVQEMVDSVVDMSIYAKKLKAAIVLHCQ